MCLTFLHITECVSNAFMFVAGRAKLLQSCLTLCDPVDCSLPGSSVRGILQARILEWFSKSSSRGSSRPQGSNLWSCLLHWQVGSFTTSTTWEALVLLDSILWYTNIPQYTAVGAWDTPRVFFFSSYYKLFGAVSTSKHCWDSPLCIYPVVHIQEFSRVHILEVALVGCRVYKSSALLDNSETSFKLIVTLPTHQRYVKVSLALHLHQHLILLEFYTDSEQMKSLLCFKFAFSEIPILVIYLYPPCPF